MSGVAQTNHTLQDQLRNIRGVIGNVDEDAFGGYVPKRRTRSKARRTQERDPFEGVVFEGKKDSGVIAATIVTDHDDYQEASFLVAERTVVGVNLPHAASSYEIGTEAIMSRTSQNPFSSDHSEDDTRKSNATPKGGNYSNYEEDELSEEEQAELDRKHRNAERTKKGIMWAVIGAGTASIVCISTVIVTGLLGTHKSRIF